jgi:cell division septal protein FtsQ
MDNENTIAFSLDKERYEYHHKKRRRKLIRLLVALIIWGIIVIYLLTPFSTYKMMHVKGNVYLSEDEVIELGDIKSTWWWMVDTNKLKSKLEKHDNIDNVSISRGFNGLNISILEKYPLALRNDKYLMNTTLELLEKDKYNHEVNNLIDISEIDSLYLNLFANQYIHVDLDIRETFYSAYMEDNKIIVLNGNFDDSSYFVIKLNLDCLSIKLSRSNFLNIKEEILGKVNNDNVKYSIDDPCIVRYNLTDVYEYEIG